MQLPSVIIIDDEMLFCKTIESVMADAGCRTNAFLLPSEALRHLAVHDCDLLITDLKMPQMDGLKLISKARRLRPAMRTVLLSAHLDQKDRESAAHLHIDLIMEKPLEMSHLVAETMALLSRRSIASA